MSHCVARLWRHFYSHARRSVSTAVALVLPWSSRSCATIAKVAYIRPDRTCIIGLKSMATIPLLTYDVFLNIFLTGLFVYPLMSRKRLSTKLHALAKRTSLYVSILLLPLSFFPPFSSAAAIALGTSVINILILTLLHGQQLGWVCLASCGFDVCPLIPRFRLHSLIRFLR